MEPINAAYQSEEPDAGLAPDVSQPIRVLIVDDHPGVRAGLRALMLPAADLVVVGEAADGEEAVRLLQRQKPDIVLLDIEMPGLRGDMVMRWIRETLPEVKVLTVSSYTDREYIQNMLENGASGYITKDEAPSVLTQAIRSISRGMNWFSPAVLRSRDERFVEDQTLTEREVRILQQLLLEHNTQEIAEFMGMDQKRLDNYLELLMRKFRVNSLDDLKRIAARVLSARKH